MIFVVCGFGERLVRCVGVLFFNGIVGGFWVVFLV